MCLRRPMRTVTTQQRQTTSKQVLKSLMATSKESGSRSTKSRNLTVSEHGRTSRYLNSGEDHMRSGAGSSQYMIVQDFDLIEKKPTRHCLPCASSSPLVCKETCYPLLNFTHRIFANRQQSTTAHKKRGEVVQKRFFTIVLGCCVASSAVRSPSMIPAGHVLNISLQGHSAIPSLNPWRT